MNEASQARALVVGCGYVGQRLVRSLGPWWVRYGLVRTSESVRRVRAAGAQPLVVDLDAARYRDFSPSWYRNGLMFYCAPPPATGESDTRLYRFLHALTDTPSVLVYLSTTGVYGNLNGQVADETTPIRPTTDRAMRRASAEEISRVWCHERGVRRVVLRVPAIYGPGRLPLERLRQGEATVRESEAPIVNRVHVDDLVQACIAAATQDTARGIYNVADGNRYSYTDYLNKVAHWAQLPAPQQVSMEHAQLLLSEGVLSYLAESRQISNSRLRESLGVVLRYSDLDEGIQASLKEEQGYKQKS